MVVMMTMVVMTTMVVVKMIVVTVRWMTMMRMTVAHDDHDDADDVDADDDDEDDGDDDDGLFSLASCAAPAAARAWRGRSGPPGQHGHKRHVREGIKTKVATARGRYAGPRLHHACRGRPRLPVSWRCRLLAFLLTMASGFVDSLWRLLVTKIVCRGTRCRGSGRNTGGTQN